jgi:hypothetical protein
MTDFYPLVRRAVSALDRNTDEDRHTLYERARNALAQTLRGSDPSPTEAEIVCECLALEKAIDQVEAPYSFLNSLSHLPTGTRAALRNALHAMSGTDMTPLR